MTTAIKITITRQTLTTELPWIIFAGRPLYDNVVLFHAAGGTMWRKIDGDTELAVICYHTFDTDNQKNDAAQYLPSWKSTSNALEVEQYMTANNITITTEEEIDPDLTGYSELDLEGNFV